MKLFPAILTCFVYTSLYAQDTSRVIVSRDTLKGVTITKVVPRTLGMEHFSLKEMEHIPVFMGERDILKTIQLLPGIKSAGDGNSGFYVRGGSADQNLILLDGTPVYNASHLMGFFSTFNGDAIKDLSFYKNAMPAQYGGRLSSVVDATTNNGDDEQYHISGGAGLIAARLNVEGPIVKNRSSFLLSGRRTYADLFAKLSRDSAIRNSDLNFYDLNLKMNFRLGLKDELDFSAYIGNDVMRLSNSFGLEWGNSVASLRWRHIYSNKLMSFLSAHYSSYENTTSTLLADESVSIYSRIRDYTAKAEFLYTANARHETRAGWQSTWHTMSPLLLTGSEGSGINNQQQPKRYSLDNALYINNTWKASDQLNISYGLRATGFMVFGGGDFYQINEDGKVTDTLRTGRGEVVKTYFNLEPRVAIRYELHKTGSLSLAFTRNVQPLHLISNATSANPTDKWIASSNLIKPEIADQVSAGYSKSISGDRYELTVETYYKSLKNQLDYRNGAEIFSNEPIETMLLVGKGRAYGMEWLLKKKTGKLTGWIGYTLSKTERRINGINDNEWYNAKQDRTHEISVVSSWQVSKKWVLSANWVYHTGNAVTFPAGKYIVMNDRLVYYYTERNGYRMPAYHRLDVAATLQLRNSALHFGVYNAYGRENAYSIYFRESKENPDYTEAVQVTLFRFVPSITYNFNF